MDRSWSTRLPERILRRIPGILTLDRYLRHRYTGLKELERYPRGHYYSPLPDIAEVRSRAKVLFRKDVDLRPSIDLRADAQYSLLADLAQYYNDFDWPEQPSPDRRFYLSNRYFGHGDAIVLYAMLRHLKPRRVIEVGSGFSSALMLDTDERFLGSRARFTFVEPFPQRLLSLLRGSDRKRIQVIQYQVQELPISLFQALEPNDILFVDSSHVSKIGSDVNFIFFDILPALRPGVVLHFHDVIWPFEYPEQWILEGRAWNEAYLLRAFLQYNRHFEILLFNSFLGHAFRSFLEESLPIFMNDTGGSLWLRRCIGGIRAYAP